MPKLKVTPWRNKEELLRVRAQFFPLRDSTRADARRDACNRVHMWKLRGNLPHSVESTCFLTEAVLHDDPQLNSPSAIRAVYSTAFCRFVTGMTDSQQDGLHKKSMYDVSREVGIPASFVEIRHEATHGELPPLVIFRRAAERSLHWLYNEYWKTLDENGRPPMFDEEGEVLKGRNADLKTLLKDLLRTHLRKCLGVTANGSAEVFRVSAETAAEIGKSIVRLCEDNTRKLQTLIDVLLERKMLVPASKTLGTPLTTIFPLWSPLLKLLVFHQRRFLPLLADAMLLPLIAPSRLDIALDDYREALYLWLLEICTSPAWKRARKRGLLVLDSVLMTCVAVPNHWTLRLAVEVMDAEVEGGGVRGRYQGQIAKAMKECAVPYTGSRNETIRALAAVQ